MDIIKNKDKGVLTLALKGRLDTTTSPELVKVLDSELDSAEKLIFDLKELEYISSSGLRALLSAQKIMNRKGGMIVKDPSEMVSEVFEITGFSDILTIE